MKNRNLLTGIATSVALTAILAPSSHAVTTNWIADGGNLTGNLTNTGNWDNGVPGIDTITDPFVKINNAAANVTVNSTISGGTAIQQFEMQGGVLNIQADASLDVGANNKDFRSGAAGGSVINQTGGTFTIRHQFQLGRTGSSNYDLSGGTLDYVGDSGSGRVMRFYDGANLNVSTNGVVNNLGSAGSGTGARLGIDNGTSKIGLSGSGAFNSTAQYQMNYGAGTVNHTFLMNGSGVTASFGSMNAYVQAAASTASLNFETDASGVAVLNIANALDLSSGDHAADIQIDLTNYTGTGDIVLIDYGSLAGTAFRNVSVVGGTGTLDYDYMGLGQIALTNIPEPSTGLLAVFSIGGLCLLRRRS